MYKMFTTYKASISYLVTCILTTILGILYGIYKDSSEFTGKFIIIFIVACSLIYFYNFRDYKVILGSENIKFFYLYRSRKSILWSNVTKLEIEKEVWSLARYKAQLIHFYSDNDICSFNISHIDKDEFLKLLAAYCSKYNITIKNKG